MIRNPTSIRSAVLMTREGPVGAFTIVRTYFPDGEIFQPRAALHVDLSGRRRIEPWRRFNVQIVLDDGNEMHVCTDHNGMVGMRWPKSLIMSRREEQELCREIAALLNGLHFDALVPILKKHAQMQVCP